MKQCPKCDRKYDNTWGVCMNCDSTKLVEVADASEAADQPKGEAIENKELKNKMRRFEQCGVAVQLRYRTYKIDLCN